MNLLARLCPSSGAAGGTRGDGLRAPLLFGVDALDARIVALPMDFRIEEDRLQREDTAGSNGKGRRRRWRRRRRRKSSTTGLRLHETKVSADLTLEQKNYARHDDVEGEYTTVRALLRFPGRRWRLTPAITESWRGTPLLSESGHAINKAVGDGACSLRTRRAALRPAPARAVQCARLRALRATTPRVPSFHMGPAPARIR